MNAQEIRDAFLGFFAQKGHKVVPSSSLLPKDDPTILFTNAGMNQFKNIFLGLEKRSFKRAASVQKCLRVSGKHNDLEQVGRTNKHHTFFEMLGNFSFGDYFKAEAVAFAWELITGIFRLDKERLYITVYEDDEEAFKIWNGGIGIPAERIFRFGKKDNFWAMGDTGPCGPCSELHYDFDPSYEAGDPGELIGKGSDRFLELWNLVFMQYFQDEKSVLHPLPAPSIDTGMGLERITAALQHRTTNYATDLFMPLIRRISEMAGREYPAGDDGDISVRIIADHARAVSFLIGDGIMPANDGRGYVLRRLIRRAFRHGNAIGIDKPFLYHLVSDVAEMMKAAYPDLLASVRHVSRVCLSEEERFGQTLASGLRFFRHLLETAKSSERASLAGADVFKLYDTFGFPLDLSQELAREHGLAVDEPGFEKELEEQRRRARMSWRGGEERKERRLYGDMKSLRIRYTGHDRPRAEEAEVLALIKEGKSVEALQKGERGEMILDVTPFYAEAGGQVGDSGWVRNPGFKAFIESAFFPVPEIIAQKAVVLEGRVRVGDRVEAEVDTEKRASISNNHTATHLLHAGLREILGSHVKQAGSLVSAERLRFDFTHFSPLSPEELRTVEAIVNRRIRENAPVETKLTTLEEGLREGAMAIFEEKYGEKVRLVRIGEFSKELCGGAHVRSTGEIGLFKIVSEASVAAGMRRIEAVTGEEALKYFQETEELLGEIGQAFQTPRKDLLAHIEKTLARLGEAEKENRALRQKLARATVEAGEGDARRIKGVPVLLRRVEGLNNDELRGLADSLKQRLGSGIVILGLAADGKAFLVVSVTKDLTPRVKADVIIRERSKLIDGGGGGRPDFAQAGGKKPEKLDLALSEAGQLIEKML